MKPKVKVGDELWLVSSLFKIYGKCIVTTVGRKYFSVKTDASSYRKFTFNITDWRQVTNYRTTCDLYESKQEHANLFEKAEKIDAISRVFSSCIQSNELDIKTIRMIYDILFPNKK